MLETAWDHGVPVRCEWALTSDGDAEANACVRILDRLGRLPEPDEFERLGRRDPAILPPVALYRYRKELEPPSVAEWFVRVDVLPFVRRPATVTGRALILDPADLVPARAALLSAFVARGFRLLVLGWMPASDPAVPIARIADRARALAARLGIPLFDGTL